MPRVYLDNAATSWPKPESVYTAVDRYQRELGVAAGRGGYRDADEVHRIVTRCRLTIARLINAASPNEIVFTQNCTDALNLAIHGILRSGEHAVTSVADHNSILRPLHECKGRGIRVTNVPLDSSGIVDIVGLREVVKEHKPTLVAVTHVSNVTGVRQPIEEIAAVSREFGCHFLLDAAQSLGHEVIDVQGLPVDLLAAPGHKGLLGPLGTGVLYANASIHAKLSSIRQGGTGTDSEQLQQPAESPAKYESGNLNVPGIVGLDAGVQFVLENDLSTSEHLLQLTQRLVKRLENLPQVELYSEANRFGIVSFNVQGFDARELAATLDSMAEIQLRAGLHCAPLMHSSLGTMGRGGAVRASFGHFSKPEEVDKLVQAIEALIANPMA